jgi:GntR family transcriptional regulator, galactonate operon transcriptional repressor
VTVPTRRGMHDVAVHEIGQRIVRGDLEPGTVLAIESLEREFGSRTVVREALRVLADKGLVGARPKRGTFVRPRDEWRLLDDDMLRWQLGQRPDMAFLDNLAEVRAIIEPAAARLAAQRRTDADLEELHAALTLAADPAAAPDQLVDADVRFHRTLLAAAGNELLQRMESVIETGLRARDLLVHGQSTWADSVPAHRAVLDAVEARDPAAAQAAMEALLDQAVRDVADLGADLDEAVGKGRSQEARA